MTGRPEVEALLGAVEKFTVPLRMGQGIDEVALDKLRGALRQCADAWRDQAVVPKLAANVLVDLYPAVEASGYLYGDDYAPGDRCSRLRTSRPLIPYPASPERPRRPYFSRTARRRTSPVALTGELHDVEQIHGRLRPGEHPAHRRSVDGAHVNGHHLDGVLPGWGRLG